MIWFVLMQLCGASLASDAFEQGLSATRAGNQVEAVARFRAALADGARAPETYHGLGNALYRQGHRGAAMAAWRRGLLLAPRDGDIAANLTRAQRDNQDELKPPASHRGAFFWQSAISPKEGGLLASFFLALGLWVLAIRRLRAGFQGVAPTRRGNGVAALMIGLGLVLGLSTMDAIQQRSGAVIVVDSVSVRSALGPEGVELFVLHEGAEVQLIEIDATQALVALQDGRKGWLSARAIITTDPADSFPAPPVNAPG
jgi:tetratricopeptide (TPR) repeat protein